MIYKLYIVIGVFTYTLSLTTPPSDDAILFEDKFLQD